MKVGLYDKKNQEASRFWAVPPETKGGRRCALGFIKQKIASLAWKKGGIAVYQVLENGKRRALPKRKGGVTVK